MPEADPNAYASLERSFHEPNRLQILAALAAAPQGLSFSDLKERTGLTDGNLSRHLKTLEEATVIRIEKAFVQNKPRTTLSLTAKGRTNFLNYLDTLEKILRRAKKDSLASVQEAPRKRAVG